MKIIQWTNTNVLTYMSNFDSERFVKTEPINNSGDIIALYHTRIYVPIQMNYCVYKGATSCTTEFTFGISNDVITDNYHYVGIFCVIGDNGNSDTYLHNIFVLTIGY